MATDDKFRDDSIDTWNEAISDALEYRRKYGREAMWAQCEAYFAQAHSMQSNNLGPNLIFSTGDALLSNLCTPNPFFNVKALRMDLLDATPVLETQLNEFVGALSMKATAELVATSAFLFGVGIGKLGYDSEFGYQPKNDIGFLHRQIVGLSLSQFDKSGRKIEYNSNVEPGMPWFEHVLPHDFLVPWGTKALKSAPWCAHRIIRHIDDIKADPKYSNKRDLVPMMSMADWMKSYVSVMKPYRAGMSSTWSQRESTDKAEYVELWEIHDARTGRVRVLSQGYDKWLRDDIDYLQEDGLPFVDLAFVPRTRSFWVTPDAAYLFTAQEEAIDMAQVMRKQRRQSLLRFAAKRGSITKDNLEKALSGELGIFFEYENTDNGQNPLIPFTPSNNNNQLQNELEWVRRDARETVGFSRNSAGEFEPGRKTATEAQNVQEKADLRLSRRQDIVAGFYCEAGRKLAKTIFKFWKTPRLVEIIGPDGAAQWTTFTGSDLKGDYRYKVGFSSEPIVSRQGRKSEAIQLFTQLSMDPAIDPIALRRYLARAFNDPEFNSLFKPGVLNNANLSNAMQPMQDGMGGAQQQTSGSGQPQQDTGMSRMPMQGG